jgi:hypothetical protein
MGRRIGDLPNNFSYQGALMAISLQLTCAKIVAMLMAESLRQISPRRQLGLSRLLNVLLFAKL